MDCTDWERSTVVLWLASLMTGCHLYVGSTLHEKQMLRTCHNMTLVGCKTPTLNFALDGEVDLGQWVMNPQKNHKSLSSFNAVRNFKTIGISGPIYAPDWKKRYDLNHCLFTNVLVQKVQFVYLFGGLLHFQHCTGHITTVLWEEETSA